MKLLRNRVFLVSCVLFLIASMSIACSLLSWYSTILPTPSTSKYYETGVTNASVVVVCDSRMPHSETVYVIRIDHQIFLCSQHESPGFRNNTICQVDIHDWSQMRLWILRRLSIGQRLGGIEGPPVYGGVYVTVFGQRHEILGVLMVKNTAGDDLLHMYQQNQVTKLTEDSCIPLVSDVPTLPMHVGILGER